MGIIIKGLVHKNTMEMNTMVDQRWKLWFPGVRTSQILTCVPTQSKMWGKASRKYPKQSQNSNIVFRECIQLKRMLLEMLLFVQQLSKRHNFHFLRPSCWEDACHHYLFILRRKLHTSPGSQRRPDSCQLRPSTGGERPRPASTTWSNTEGSCDQTLQDKFTLLVFGCLVQNVKLIFGILFFSYVLKWGAEGEPTQFGMSE